MKVVFINNLYPPYAVGGAEKVVEQRAEELTAQGGEARIITGCPWHGWGSWRPEKGVAGEIIIYRYWVPNIFSYKNLSKHNFFWKLGWHKIDVWNWWSARIVKKILQQESPDKVETHNLMGMGFCIPKVIQKLGFKHTHVLHDVQLVEPSGVLPWDHDKDNLIQKVYAWLIKKKFGQPDMVVIHSEFLHNFYEDRNFFTNSEWQVENNKITNYKLQITNKPQNQNPKFLFVGSLVKHKGIKLLMQAWDNVCHPCAMPAGRQESRDPELDFRLRANDIQLHIVGDGILLTEVEDWAKNHPEVKVHGRLEGEELAEVYQKSDILIFPSICLENKPVTIIEALEHGLEVIAANTGGVSEFVREKENAWLFKPGEVGELVKRIKRFV